jgi:hypothetical protein
VQIKRESGPDALPKRSGAGLFGVVLLCALPTLLSLPAPTVPYAASRFSFTPGPGAHRAPLAQQTESLLDWTGMDVDGDDDAAGRRKVHLPLSFLNGQHGLSDLFQGSSSGSAYDWSPSSELDSSDGQTEAEFDVSFVPSNATGKIRVRIESPSDSASSTVPSLTSGGSSPLSSGSPALTFASTSNNANANAADGWDLDFAAPEHAQGMMWDTPAAGANVDMSLFAAQTASASSRRRVRIALKNGPVAGAEGGEWEVEVR